MTEKLYIASFVVGAQIGVPTPFSHLYLVFDPDGIPNSNDERVIRGGPEIGNLLPFDDSPLIGSIVIESASSFSISRDGPIRDSDQNIISIPTPEERNFTLIAEGQEAENIFNTAVGFVNNLGQQGDNNDIITNIQYVPFQANSNSVTTSALAEAGVDILDNLPVIGGDLDGTSTGVRLNIGDVPATTTFLSGSDDNEFAGGDNAVSHLFIDVSSPNSIDFQKGYSA